MKSHAVIGAMLLSALGVHPTFAGTNTWTPTGPEGGLTSAVHYLGTPVGAALAANGDSVYRSTDNGVTWTAVLKGLEGEYRNIASNPTNPNRVLLGIERALYISDDGGLTFKDAGDYPPLNLEGTFRLVYAPDGQVVYALVAGKLLRSADGGSSWTETTGTLPTNTAAHWLVVSKANHDVLFLGAQGTSGNLYKSIDAGASWNPVMPTTGYVSSVAIDPNNENIMLAITQTGVQRSINGGASWTVAYFDFPSYVYFDPLVANRAFMIYSHGRTLRSVDGGATWSTAGDIKATSLYSVAFDPNQAGKMMYGSSDGVATSENAGTSWQKRNVGFHGGTFSDFITHTTTSGLYVTGEPGPLGIFSRSVSGVWEELNADAMRIGAPFGFDSQGIVAAAVAPTDANVIYAIRSRGFYKSINGGAQWTLPANATFGGGQTLVLAVDPLNAQVVYVGTNDTGLFRSADGGATWESRSTGLPPIMYKRHLVIDPVNSSVLYLSGAGNGVFKSVDAGLNWAPANQGFTVNTDVNRFAIEPGSPNTVYATSNSGLYRSDDAGATWVRNTAILAGQASTIAIDPAMPNVIYALTMLSGNVYRSLDRGATWRSMQFTQALPLQIGPMRAITVDPRKPTNILISVQSRGMWEYQIASDLELTSTSSLVANNLEQSAVVQVKNVGPNGITGVKAIVDVPADARNVTVQTTKGTCSLTGTRIECTQSALALNETLDITVTLIVASTSPLSASVTARESETASSNNTLSITPQSPPPPVPAPAPTTSGGGGGGGGGALQVWTLLCLSALWIARRRRAEER